MVVALAVSAALDATLREPPARCHPVVWMGRYLAAAERCVPSSPPRTAMLRGGVAWALGLVASVAAATVVRGIARSLPGPAGAVLSGAALWTLWSGRLLLDEVSAVARAMSAPEGGRSALARIVSRDVSALDPSEVAGSAVESLAENLSDSVVGPLVWFVLGGLPAAAAYRYINTADACWGYRSERWLYAGRVAARTDDVANLVPARLTGAMLVAGLPRERVAAWPGEARRTPSPNSGRPMAAMALRLGLRLAKPGTYVLNPSGRPPDADDVLAAVRVGRRLIAAALVLAGLAAATRPRR